MEDPSHPEYEGYCTWLRLEEGESWDPNAFTLLACNQELQHYQELDEQF